MKAALCKTLTGPDDIVIEDIAEPIAGPGEAVIAVKAAALNFLDTLAVRGKYQFKPPMPFSPASEFAGVVESVGAGVTNVKVGDRVFGSAGHGAAREKMAVKTDNLIMIPAGVSDEVAASVTVAYGTALHGLKDRGKLKAGENVVILGASGGAGLAAVELAKLMGGRVIACASTDEKLAVCKARGADALINYSSGDLKDEIRKQTGGNGADIVYDCVGDKFAEPAIRAMNWDGRYLVVGFAGGQIPKIPLNLLLLKSSSLVGVFWGAHAQRDPAENRANLKQLIEWVAEGKLRPHIHKVFPLSQTGDAIRELDRRASTGKVIIKP